MWLLVHLGAAILGLEDAAGKLNEHLPAYATNRLLEATHYLIPDIQQTKY